MPVSQAFIDVRVFNLQTKPNWEKSHEEGNVKYLYLSVTVYALDFQVFTLPPSVSVESHLMPIMLSSAHTQGSH